MKRSYRLIIQSILSGPLIIGALPFSLFITIGSFYQVSTHNFNNLGVTTLSIFGSFGLISLYLSIFIRTVAFQKYKWLRRVVILGLLCGLTISLTILFTQMRFETIDRDFFLMMAFYQAPTGVALWNIKRIYSKT